MVISPAAMSALVRRSTTGEPVLWLEHGELCTAVLIECKNRLGAPGRHLAINRWGRLEILKGRGVAQAGGGLAGNAHQRVHTFGVKVIAGVNTLSRMHTTLVRALVYTGFQRVKKPVPSS